MVGCGSPWDFQHKWQRRNCNSAREEKPTELKLQDFYFIGRNALANWFLGTTRLPVSGEVGRGASPPHYLVPKLRDFCLHTGLGYGLY